MSTPPKVWSSKSLLGDQDRYLFNEGTHTRLYNVLGAHPIKGDPTNPEDRDGTFFGVWAPNAAEVSVVGDFNFWNRSTHPLVREGSTGIWRGFIPGVGPGVKYKYFIRSQVNNYTIEKFDPFAFHNESPPQTASVVWDLDYGWHDEGWMRQRAERNALNRPIAVYEMHLGSWRHEWGHSLNYVDLARTLPGYLNEMGYTHVEFMPVMEHPFYASWGYQIVGYFTPTSRFGSPQEFMQLIDALHQAGIGVILDWVPSHFPTDGHGLGFFDGTHLYEHADPRQGYHPDWNTFIFNFSRYEVRSFMISNANFWMDKYHIDGLRVDAVASMLYLDSSRKEGGWIPNKYGGRENLDSIDFLKQCNVEVHGSFPGILMIAEDSSAWPMVTQPTYNGGLGFDLKWDMGWMHDTLKYIELDPVHRKFHQNELTFRMVYAGSEHYLLPLSHDEVVYGKGSMIRKMPGDDWQKFANLRLLYGYMWGQLGKKLLFMGGEFAQWSEWNHDEQLNWYVLEQPLNAGMQRWIKDLNLIYQHSSALYERDADMSGFEWIDCNDAEQSVLSFIRRGNQPDDVMAIVCNFTPVAREGYWIGVPGGGAWHQVLNSDDLRYGGSGVGNFQSVEAQPRPVHGRSHAIQILLPPLSVMFLTRMPPITLPPITAATVVASVAAPPPVPPALPPSSEAPEPAMPPPPIPAAPTLTIPSPVAVQADTPAAIAAALEPPTAPNAAERIGLAKEVLEAEPAIDDDAVEQALTTPDAAVAAPDEGGEAE